MAEENLDNDKNVTYISLKNLLEEIVEEFFTNKLLTKKISINQDDLTISNNGINFNEIKIGNLTKTLTEDEIAKDTIKINQDEIAKVTKIFNSQNVSQYFVSNSDGEVVISDDFKPSYDENKNLEAGYKIEIYKLNTTSLLSLVKNMLKIGESELTSNTIDKANGIEYMTLDDLNGVIV